MNVTSILRARGASTLATAAATAAIIAAGVGAPAVTRAASGDGVILGWVQQESSTTMIQNQVNDKIAFEVNSQSGTAIYATSASTIAIEGYGEGIGVRGTSDMHTGVRGESSQGDGVVGMSSTADGVLGMSNTGTGVKATSTGGTALQVVGKTTFSRSGRKTITAGHSTLVITLPGVTASSYVLATLQTNRSGVYVRAAVPATGKITIYLSKALTASAVVAFFVIN